MPYSALPDMRIPYDNDGTVVGSGLSIASNGFNFAAGIAYFPTSGQVLALNDGAMGNTGGSGWGPAANGSGGGCLATWMFFPETREVTAWTNIIDRSWTTYQMQGSGDSTNGVDGTWETASVGSLPGGVYTTQDVGRATIVPVSFTGPKRTIRCYVGGGGGGSGWTGYWWGLYLYGEKAAGQTPDDLIYINHDDTPGVEYAAPEDFGDQPLGTTVVRQFRLKNTSATKTANTINVQCNDSDFAISTDGTTWVVTISIASLGPGAQSATMYVRCTTPAPGNVLGPRFARIVTTVASYT